MAENQYIGIGYTKKTHGLKGELKLIVEDRYLEDFLKNERIFVDVKGTKVPFFITNVRGKGEMILKLEDVDSLDVAYGLQSREIFLREKDLVPDHERELEIEEETLEYEHLTGFLLRDKNLGEIVTIEEVLEMPQQEMALLKYKGREVLVPLNERFVVTVDDKTKTVHTDLPEGLLDM
ncbi:MAG: hypothetical protein IPJ82_05435 [Lewinellaceae bacterium]|nr:hypothetical protein [Lewinellaceae bacterium]